MKTISYGHLHEKVALQVMAYPEGRSFVYNKTGETGTMNLYFNVGYKMMAEEYAGCSPRLLNLSASLLFRYFALVLHVHPQDIGIIRLCRSQSLVHLSTPT